MFGLPDAKRYETLLNLKIKQKSPILTNISITASAEMTSSPATPPHPPPHPQNPNSPTRKNASARC